MAKIRGRLPSIPEYFAEMINREVDLNSEPKQCCPFHKEDTPSFSYSADKGVWRCFGGCHVGGDVVDLHKVNYKLSSRDEAKKSLYAIYEVTEKKVLSDSMLDYVNEERIMDNAVYAKLLIKANCPKRWLELDYVMSKHPLEMADLRGLLDSWEH